MNNKGISTIVALILVLVITVVLAGAFLIWSSATVSQLQSTSGAKIEGATASAGKTLAFDNVACAASPTAYVRNTGTAAITVADLRFLTESAANSNQYVPVTTASGGGTSIAAGAVSTAITLTTGTGGGSPTSGSNIRVRVTGPANSDTFLC